MENVLNISIIQSDIVWENPTQNLSNLSQKIEKISNETDLIVLQEMFTTGYTLNAESMAETMTGDTIKWMLEKAKEKEALIMGSLIIKVQTDKKDHSIKYFNRVIVAYPSGETNYYDKRHLFSYANEDNIYTAGKDRMIVEYKGWRLLPLVCYDLRFPVWSRNTNEFDVIIYMANWPNTRISAWDTLLNARAIENLCYVVGVNRLGVDDNKLKYIGHSMVINAMGEVILQFEENQEGFKSVFLNKNYIMEVRKKFGFLNDRDSFAITD